VGVYEGTRVHIVRRCKGICKRLLEEDFWEGLWGIWWFVFSEMRLGR
jgi:hypothetical protein